MLSARSGHRSSGLSRSSVLSALVAISGAVLAVAWILVRPLAWDEVEFFRATDWVWQGRVPYRDFWEHHSPLQWFAYAPFTDVLDRTGGVADILVLRWVQVPVWALAIVFWVRRAQVDVPGWPMPAAVGLLFLTPAFVVFAVEYRVDGLASVLFLAGCVLATQPGYRPALGGCLLALAPAANLRLGPQVLVAVLILAVIDTGRGRWALGRRAVLFLSGALAPALVALAYLVSTRSFGHAWQQLILDNHFVGSLPLERHRRFWDIVALTVLEKDGIPLLLLAGGGLGALRALRAWRRPRFLFVCAVLFLANLTFIQGLNTVYFYHFQTCLLLSTPLVADLLRVAAAGSLRSGFLACLSVALALWGLGLHVRGLHHSFEREWLPRQDEILKSVERFTNPDETVWDGCGFALRREPAYEYWFLPVHARILAKTGRFAPLTIADFESAAPAAALLNARTLNWLRDWPELGRFVQANYLPVRPYLWVPAPSGLLAGPGHILSWRVLRSGTYRVVASSLLASHAHFQSPYWFVGATLEDHPPGLTIDANATREGLPPLTIRRGGRPVPVGGSALLELRRGDVLEVQSGFPGMLGVFVVPRDVPRFFEAAHSRGDLDPPLFSYY